MKKLIAIIAIITCECIGAVAQETYYYNGNDKIPLKVDSQRIVTIIDKAVKSTPFLGDEFKLIKTLPDLQNDIRVYQYDQTLYTPQRACMAALPNHSFAMMVQPCCIDGNTGMELRHRKKNKEIDTQGAVPGKHPIQPHI